MRDWIRRFGDAIEAPLRRRQMTLQERRNAVSGETEFVEALASLNICDTVSQAVYRSLQSVAVVPNFVVRPDDELHGVFGLLDEDLDDFVESLFEDLAIPLPSSSELIREPSVRNVKDLSEFVNRYYARVDRSKTE
jgi:hypothetical protein